MKKIFTTPFRLASIASTLARYRIDELAFSTVWLRPFRMVALANPFRYGKTKHLNRGQRLCQAIEELGPIYIKFGQLLSSRHDLLPPDVVAELAKLQDKVQPFSGQLARKIIEESLEQPLETLFASFEDQALASASVAQVHAATLHSGEQVVVKVLRPKVKQRIENDLAVLKLAAKLANRFLKNAERIRPQEVVAEFEMGLHAELDLKREAANATLLRRNAAGSRELYIPAVHWDYCAKQVMVMERIYGVPVYDLEAIKAQGTDLKRLAETGLNMFFTQVFRDNFFHADMHPGNLFVSNENKQQFIAVDFGIVGSLTDADRRYIAENLLAFFQRDYRRVAVLHVDAGWVDADTRVDEFEAAIRTVSEPLFEKPLKDISIGQVILNLFRIARSFNLTVQPQLILLQKTLFNVESLGRNLDPEMDLWKTAKPYLEQWMKEQVGPKMLLKRLKEEAPSWIEKLPEMPGLLHDALQSVKELSKQPQQPAMPATKKSGRVCLGLGAGLVIGSAVLFASLPTAIIAGWSLLGVGVLSLLIGAKN